MPTPTIPAGNLFMNATTYTGNGSSLTVTNGAAGASFQPDFVWIKNRSSAYDHYLYDSIRGANVKLSSNTTDAQATQTNGLDAFISNGFSLNGGRLNTNENGSALVGWQWKANGTAVTNNTGSISSQVSANTTSGFSVVTYTGNSVNGATVGHGLGVTPAMIIIKERSAVNDWLVWHQSNGTQIMFFTTAAKSTNAGAFNNTLPTSSVITLGTWDISNGSPNTYVAYCWAPIAGYSAFGSYTGNGSTDGPFVYTGFRPRFVLTRRSDAVESWRIGDSSRSPYNAVQLELFANLANAEENNSNQIDYLSNGFKIRTSGSGHNASGGTYIYMVFAENPFKYANAR